MKFVEYNAENPSSLTDQTGLNEILLEVGAMRDVSKRYQLRQFSPEKHLLNALLNTFRQWGGAGAPSIAILDWNGLPTAHEFVMLEEFFPSQGIPTLICAPEQLEYENGRLRCGSFPIDLVYKRVIINELLAACDDSHPLIRAYLAGDICLVNSFRCKMVHKKASFELLTDEANAGWFTAREKEVIRRTVPWTRRLIQRKTQHGAREVDLVEHVRRHRAQFILKPNDDYGGRGIAFGDRLTSSEWDAALSEALAGDYVVQEKVELRTEVFPIFAESGWALQPCTLIRTLFYSNSVYMTATTMTLAGIVACQVGNASACRSDSDSILRLGFTTNRMLIGGIVIEVCLLLILIYVSPLRSMFGLAPLAPIHWLLLSGSFGPLLLLLKNAARRCDDAWQLNRCTRHGQCSFRYIGLTCKAW